MRLIDYDRLEEYAMEYQERNPRNPLTRGDFKLIDNFLFECTLMNDISITPTAQEPVEPIQGRDDQDEDIFCCGVCGAVVGETYLGPPGECEVRDNYCPECGRAVKWDG